MSTGEPAPDNAARPVLRVVRGEPSAEELAALAALVTARSGGGTDAVESPGSTRGRWGDPAAGQRRPWAVGPGGWRAAAR